MSDKYRDYSITFMDLLAIVFIAFKLAGIINWPWIWVLCPIWIGVILAILGIWANMELKKRKLKRKNLKNF